MLKYTGKFSEYLHKAFVDYGFGNIGWSSLYKSMERLSALYFLLINARIFSKKWFVLLRTLASRLQFAYDQFESIPKFQGLLGGKPAMLFYKAVIDEITLIAPSDFPRCVRTSSHRNKQRCPVFGTAGEKGTLLTLIYEDGTKSLPYNSSLLVRMGKRQRQAMARITERVYNRNIMRLAQVAMIRSFKYHRGVIT